MDEEEQKNEERMNEEVASFGEKRQFLPSDTDTTKLGSLCQQRIGNTSLLYLPAHAKNDIDKLLHDRGCVSRTHEFVLECVPPASTTTTIKPNQSAAAVTPPHTHTLTRPHTHIQTRFIHSFVTVFMCFVWVIAS